MQKVKLLVRAILPRLLLTIFVICVTLYINTDVVSAAQELLGDPIPSNDNPLHPDHEVMEVDSRGRETDSSRQKRESTDSSSQRREYTVSTQDRESGYSQRSDSHLYPESSRQSRVDSQDSVQFVDDQQPNQVSEATTQTEPVLPETQPEDPCPARARKRAPVLTGTKF